MNSYFYPHFIKPVCDVMGGIIFSILTLPLILALCIFIRSESKGSPIFIQRRVGKNLKMFPIFKLRTMVSNAESIGPGFTSSGDSRITRLGNFLRKTSLDELPQFWNMALGQMSLIGPRPGLPAERRYYPNDEVYFQRHSMKPGITGLSQATFRSSGTVEQVLSADLEYASRCSLLLDLRIIWMTIDMVVRRKGTN